MAFLFSANQWAKARKNPARKALQLQAQHRLAIGLIGLNLAVSIAALAILLHSPPERFYLTSSDGQLHPLTPITPSLHSNNTSHANQPSYSKQTGGQINDR